jgi:phosphohistidine phosphatase
MIVYLCRHASAGRRRADPGQDERRRLDERGQQQARQMGAALAALGVRLDAILTSPLRRATQTAALVAGELGYQSAWQREDALRPEADFAAFRAMLDRYAGCEAILAVGHKPSLPACLSRLLGAPRAAVDLKKGAVAKIEIEARQARLQWLLTPSLAERLYAKPTARSRPKTARK